MSVPRERGTLFFCLFWFNKTGATFQKYGNSSTNSFRGILSFSLSLSLVFVVAFHQTHLIPVKDRQTDRKTERQRDRQTDRQTYVLSVSLSVCLVRSVSQEENLMSPFSKRELRPPPNYYPIIIGGEEDREISSLIETTREKKKTTTEKKNQTI